MTQYTIDILDKEKNKVADVEVYFPRFRFENARYFHTDTIKGTDMSYEEAIRYIQEHQLTLSDIEYDTMDQDDYNNSICANGGESFDFGELYGDNEAKVLCILLPNRFE